MPACPILRMAGCYLDFDKLVLKGIPGDGGGAGGINGEERAGGRTDSVSGGLLSRCLIS